MKTKKFIAMVVFVVCCGALSAQTSINNIDATVHKAAVSRVDSLIEAKCTVDLKGYNISELNEVVIYITYRERGVHPIKFDFREDWERDNTIKKNGNLLTFNLGMLNNSISKIEIQLEDKNNQKSEMKNLTIKNK